MQEAIVAEMRASVLDLHARAKFVEPGEEFSVTRQLVMDRFYPDEAWKRTFVKQMEQSAKSLESAAAAGQFDVG